MGYRPINLFLPEVAMHRKTSHLSGLLIAAVCCVSLHAQTTGVWTNVSPAGLTTGQFGYGQIAVNPNRLSDLYIGSGTGNSGVMKSTDYGKTWAQISTVQGWYGFGVTGTSPATVFMGTLTGDGSLYRSTDAGVTFQITGGGLASQPYNFFADPYDVGHIIIGLHEVDGVAESNDTGRTFHMVSSTAMGTPGWPSGGVSWFPFFINTGTASTTRGKWLAIGQNGGGVCMTTNGGASWSVPTALAGLQHPHGTAQIFQTSSTLFVAGIYGPGQGVYRSTDLGKTWARVDDGSQTEAAVWGSSQHIYAGYGWAMGAGGTVPLNYEVASQPGTSWSRSVSAPAGISDGIWNIAITNDGTNDIFVGSMWASGLWRFVEPAAITGVSQKVPALVRSAAPRSIALARSGAAKMVITGTEGLFDVKGRNIKAR